MLNIGEFLGTFLLMFLGLGSSIFLGDIQRYQTGILWAITIFIATMTGNIFSSSNLNPIFTFLSVTNLEITGIQALVELLSQFLGAFLGSMIIYLLFKSKELEISNFVAIGNSSNHFKNIVIEASGTFLLVLGVKVIQMFHFNQYIQSSLCSSYIGFLIYLISPTTGASFNCIRDLGPRSVYILFYRSDDKYKNIIASNFGPIIGGVVTILFPF